MFRGPLPRTVALQLFKRSPINARRLVRTPKAQHTKGIALFVSAYARLAGTSHGERYADELPGLVELLKSKAIPQGDTVAWAYEFHMQTRWGQYRAGQPNVVATAMAGHALLDARAWRAMPSTSSWRDAR